MQIDLKHISKIFRGKTVLDNLNLTIESGKLFVVMGRSGSGKTTLLRLISGLEHPDAGIIRLGDNTVYGNGRFVQPYERKVGLIFQELALWPHLTVANNCEVVIRHIIKNKHERKERVQEVLKRFHIDRFANEYPHTLSAGEKQRASLARAVIADPKIVLLDEPLNYLDVHLKEEIIRVIKQMNEEMGITILYVTHEPDEASMLDGICGILEQGRIETIGRVSETVDYFIKSGTRTAKND